MIVIIDVCSGKITTMASSKENGTMNAWTIYDHIDEYRGKVALKGTFKFPQFYKLSLPIKKDSNCKALQNTYHDNRICIQYETCQHPKHPMTSVLEKFNATLCFVHGCIQSEF